MDKQEILKNIENKEYRKANELINSYLAEDPDNIEIKKLSGLCSINLSETNKAQEIFEEMVKIDDQDALSAYYLATIYINKN